MTPLRIFIGYDPRQPAAYTVAAHSVASRASVPVAITRLQLAQLPLTRRGLTEFTYSRFLVPWLSMFEGVSIFLDADVLCRGDVVDLTAYPQEHPGVGVFVVPHALKFERPSVMVFRNALCTKLTPAFVQDPANNLFNFDWAERVGALPAVWNHLVGYDAPNPDAQLVHFTQGVPCWPETKDCEFAGEWQAALRQAISTVTFQELMGASVHVPHVQQRLARAR